jgi:hypothetical protein
MGHALGGEESEAGISFAVELVVGILLNPIGRINGRMKSAWRFFTWVVRVSGCCLLAGFFLVGVG